MRILSISTESCTTEQVSSLLQEAQPDVGAVSKLKYWDLWRQPLILNGTHRQGSSSLLTLIRNESSLGFSRSSKIDTANLQDAPAFRGNMFDTRESKRYKVECSAPSQWSFPSFSEHHKSHISSRQLLSRKSAYLQLICHPSRNVYEDCSRCSYRCSVFDSSHGCDPQCWKGFGPQCRNSRSRDCPRPQ